LIVAGTGHRPKYFTEQFGSVIGKAETKLRYSGAKTFICGMAEGFDLLAAQGAMDLGIEVWAARPWTGHKVGPQWTEYYERVLAYASKIEVVVEADTYPGHWCMMKRNQWMVDNYDVVMSYLKPGTESGGTFQCVKYAKSKSKPVANIYLDPPF
jgi:hypothetical protein